MFATLSFNRAPYSCVVPWRSIFAVVGDDGRGMVWPEDMPREIAAEVEREVRRRGIAGPTTAASDNPAKPAACRRSNRKRHVSGIFEEVNSADGQAANRDSRMKDNGQTDDGLRIEGQERGYSNRRMKDNGQTDDGGRIESEERGYSNGRMEQKRAAAAVRKRRGVQQKLPPYLRVVK